MTGNKGGRRTGGAPKPKVKLKSKTETRWSRNNKRQREEGDLVGKVFDALGESITGKKAKSLQSTIQNSRLSRSQKRALIKNLQDKQKLGNGQPTTVTNIGKNLLSWLNRHPAFTIAAPAIGLGTGLGRTALQGFWKGSQWSPDWFSNNEEEKDTREKSGQTYVLIGDKKVPAVIGNDRLIRLSLENPQQSLVEESDSVDTFQDPGIRVDTLSNDSIANLWR